MREYLHFFRIPFILVGILAVVTVGSLLFLQDEDASVAVRSNTECATTERVFDYADVMSDEEEEKLREQIAQAQVQTQCDIVVVTLNESLVEYAASYEDSIGAVPISQCVMVYADNFYDENKFGYDAPYGDGVLFLDNWYREADGHVHSWMSTSGRAEDVYSSSMIDDLLTDSLDYVDEDPYLAYSTMVDYFVIDMTGGSLTGGSLMKTVLNPFYVFAAALIVSLVFLVVNWSSKKGECTTNDRTYVLAGSQRFRRREDRFLYKNVTKRKIESSSSSGGGGGGGHHVSSGGHSHGGGGHSR